MVGFMQAKYYKSGVHMLLWIVYFPVDTDNGQSIALLVVSSYEEVQQYDNLGMRKNDTILEFFLPMYYRNEKV